MECILEEEIKNQDGESPLALKDDLLPCLLSHMHAILDWVLLPGGLTSPHTFRSTSLEEPPLVSYDRLL